MIMITWPVLMNGGVMLMADPIMPLTDDQVRAIRPDSSVWVMASAGSGKTQVLTDRVIRLLIDGTKPEAILCLTFTKAAATEMATRIYDRLANFVRLDDAALKARMSALDAATDDKTLERARSLFARSLEAHGGLKIQTIHSFCQSLLARFPLEAGLVPGFATLDDRTSATLEREAIIQMLSDAFEQNDTKAIADFQTLATEVSDDGLLKTLSQLAHTLAQVSGSDAFLAEGMEPRVRATLGLPLAGDAKTYLASLHTSHELDIESVRHVASVWKQCTGINRPKAADTIYKWLGDDQPEENFDTFKSAFLSTENEPFAQSTVEQSGAKKIDPDIFEHCLKIAGQLTAILSKRALFQWVPVAAAANRLAHRLTVLLQARKQESGLISFSDLISKTETLLQNPMAAWILYKLDDKIQHILLDEAQDTNKSQWHILDGLSSEFYAGQSASEVRRTFFSVGDEKQAIFGFQGSEPDIFMQKGRDYHQRTTEAGLTFDEVSLSRSFRSTAAILHFVDTNLNIINDKNLGRQIHTPPHVANRAAVPGEVVLWPAITVDKEELDDSLETFASPPWQLPAERVLAKRIAQQIKAWIEGDEPISIEHRSGRRRVRPGDILILVRKRSDLMAALVSELKTAGVAVAGVDRMMLTKQLAVMDLLACIRFALQPQDDLMLATLLRSPFLGWDEDDLFGLAHARAKGLPLWSALRDAALCNADAKIADAATWIHALLNAADRTPPYEFLMTILETMQGRAALLQRLGMEADDPITMLLDSALEYELDHMPSLQGFLYWLDSSEQHIKRDPDAPLDQVRLMTIHGAKGLQAPVVILADCCGLPLESDKVITLKSANQNERLPIWFARKGNLKGPLEEEAERNRAKQQAENWRLWYVALTRAADRLYITGWTSNRSGSKDETTWYQVAEASFDTLEGVDNFTSPRWGEAKRFAIGAFPAPSDTADEIARTGAPFTVPDWVHTPPAQEAVPPRPLYPSMITDEAAMVWPSPSGEQQSQAMLRGKALHKLLEILPALPASERLSVAQHLLPSATFADRDAMVAAVMGLIADPAFADVFSEDALVEVPISAVLASGQVLSGRIDRLIMTQSAVLCVDYKSNLTVPASINDVPVAYIRQMAAYTNALSRIYTGLDIHAAIVWTAQPKLMILPPELLSAYFE